MGVLSCHAPLPPTTILSKEECLNQGVIEGLDLYGGTLALFMVLRKIKRTTSNPTCFSFLFSVMKEMANKAISQTLSFANAVLTFG